MSFSSGRSDLYAEIEEQFFVLKRMVQEVPELIRKSFQETGHHIQKEALKIGGGDKDMEHSTFSALYNLYGMDGEGIILDNTYKAIAVVIYSSYETYVAAIAKWAKCLFIKRRFLCCIRCSRKRDNLIIRYIKYLKKRHKLILQSQSDIDEIYYKYRRFRNMIVHNLNGSNINKKTKNILKDKKGVVFTQEGAVVIKSPEYLIDTIKIMENILRELISKLEKVISLSDTKNQNDDK